MRDRAEKQNRQLKVMKTTGCLFLLAASLAAATTGVSVHIVGGTVPDVPSKANFRLDLTAADSLVFHAEKMELRIGHRKINTIEYGQNVSRRYAAAILISPVLLLSKSR